jgi:hypothetical protein
LTQRHRDAKKNAEKTVCFSLRLCVSGDCV